MSNWYVLYVRNGEEQKISNLLQEHELNAFIPMKEEFFKKDGERRIVLRILYPGYVFIKSDLKQIDFSKTILTLRRQIKGIFKELKYEDTTALSSEEQLFLSGLLDCENTIRYSVGNIINDKVMIIEGPLVGKEGIIRKIDRHKHLATIEVPIFGKMIKTVIALEIISKSMGG